MGYMFALGLAAALLPAVRTANNVDPLSGYPRSEALAANLAWHNQIGEGEVRMSWFLGGMPNVAMVCTAELSTWRVKTSREVYFWASQVTKTRELSAAQVRTLGEMAKRLPPSVPPPEFKNLVLVSVSEGGKAKTYLYDRSALPREIVRLYDLTGADLETK